MRIVRHTLVGSLLRSSRAAGHNNLNTRAPANADGAALPAANADEAALPAVNVDEAARPAGNADEAALSVASPEEAARPAGNADEAALSVASPEEAARPAGNADEAALSVASPEEAARPAGNADEAALSVASPEEAAPMERQEAPSQPDVLIVEYPEHQPADASSRTVQISMDAMHLFLSVYAMQLRALRRRGGITRVDMNISVDECPEVVFCSIVITGESEESVRRVAEYIEESGWSDYQPIERDIFEQDEYMSTP